LETHLHDAMLKVVRRRRHRGNLSAPWKFAAPRRQSVLIGQMENAEGRGTDRGLFPARILLGHKMSSTD
jgi:hypothetical protein